MCRVEPLEDMTRTNLNTLRAASIGVLVAVFVLLFAVPALAQGGDPTGAQYDAPAQTGGAGGGGSVASGIPGTASDSSGGDDGALQQNIVGSLPITGLDVLALAAVAIALAIMGFALRVMTEPAGDRRR